jgi:monoamine oxidase
VAARLSRREFLYALAAVGGAGTALGTLEVWDLVAPAAEYRVPFDPPRKSDFSMRGRGNDTTVLILGAGIAGLTAAYELEKAGYRCRILEARARPGGRNWTVRRGSTDTDLDGVNQVAQFSEDLYMNAGPARIPQHHTTLDYCRELGVAIEPFANVNADAYYFNEEDDRFTGGLTGQRVRQRAVKADYVGYTSELLAKVVNQGALDAELSAADREALVELLRAVGALGPDDRYLGSGRRGYRDPPGAGNRPGVASPPFDLSELLTAGFGYYFPFELEWDQAMMMFEPVGGMDRLPYAFVRALEGEIVYSAEVRSINSTEEGVEVIYTRDGRNGIQVRADYAVCTIPPRILARINSSFTPELKRGLTSVTMIPTAKMGLEFRRRFWEEDDRIFGGITNTNLDIGTIWYPSSGFLGKRGILIGYYNYFDQALSYDALSPAERVERAIDQGRKVHGEVYSREFETGFSAQWSRIKHSEGGWALWADRGENYRLLGQPQGRVYFAGDHLSYVTSWQHGAFESARQAVIDLHQRVLNA